MNKLICILLVIFIYSCKKGEKTTDVLLINQIDISTANKVEKLNINIKKIIFLETKKEALIAQATEIIIRNEKIYLYDKRSNSIFIFDMKGKLLDKICKLGKGPGEYISTSAFDVNEMGDIFIICLIQQKIIKYNKGDKSDFIEYSIGKNPFVSFRLKDSVSLYALWVYDKGEMKYQIAEYNIVSREIKSLPIKVCDYFEIDKTTFASDIFFNISDTIIAFYPSLTNRIYELTKDRLVGYSEIQGLKYPDEVFFKTKNLEFDMDYSISIDNCYQNDRYYRFKYMEGRNHNSVLFDKKNKITYITHDKNYNNTLFQNTIGIYNNAFIAHCPFDRLEKYKDSKEVKQLLNKTNDFNINSNPVLIFYDFNY